MAFSKNRRLADLVSSAGEVSSFVDASVTHADLHTSMDLTGKTVTVANASTGDSDTTAANTAFVQQEIAALVDSAPGTLNTLNELAAALGDDANYATTTTNAIATKAPLASPTFTGTITGPHIVSTSNTATQLKNATDQDIQHKFETNVNDYAIHRLIGSDGLDNKFIIGYGPNHGSTPQHLALKNSHASGSIGFNTGASSTERMRIKSDGNVGIGETNPNSPLHVKTTDQSIQIRNTGNANVGLEIYRNSDGAKGASFAWGNGNANLEIKNYRNDGQSTGPYANIDFHTGGTDADSPDFNPTRRMRIQQTGEVGIGQDDPVTTLHIGDGASHYVRIENAGSGDISSGYQIYRGSSIGMSLYDNPADNTRSLLCAGSLNINCGGSGADLHVNTNGKVGIGTTAPGHPLSVRAANAKITAESTADSQVIGFQAKYQDHATLYGSFEYHTGDAQLYIDNNFTGNGTNYSDINFRNKDTSGNFQTAIKIKGGNAGNNGYVGIGVSSPLGKLHVRDGSAQSGISHTYIYDGSAISVEANEPAIQLMAEDSGTHGGSLLWRYGNNAFSAIANPTTDTLDFTYGVTTGNDFQAHSGHNLSSYKKMMSIHNDGIITAPYQPAFCVYNPGGTYPTAGGSKAFGKNDGTDGNYSTHVNAGSHFSTTTGRFTAPVAGNYYFSFSAMFDSSGNAGFDFEVNDVAQNGGEGLDSDNSTYTQVAGSILLALSVNDYVTLTLRGRRVHQRYGSFEGFLVG